MSELTATTDVSTPWPEGSGRPAQLFLVGEGFADAVAEMQQRVASRLAADAARYANLDSAGKVLRTKTLVNEELEAWVNHRARVELSRH